MSQDEAGTRLLAALADDGRGEINLIATDVAGRLSGVDPRLPRRALL